MNIPFFSTGIGKKNTIIFDADSSKLMFRTPNDGKSETKYLSIEVDKASVDRGQICEAFESALNKDNSIATFDGTADLVLPDTFFAFDYITLPTLNKMSMGDSFKAEARTMYKNFADLSINSQIVFQSKVSTTYRVVMIQKSLLAKLKDVFSAKGINLANAIPSCCVCAVAASKLNGNYRKNPSVLLVANENTSKLVICNKDAILGYVNLPFGTEALKDDKVCEETILYHQSVAELAIINAKEKAKATKLTMAINIEEEKIDDDLEEDSSEQTADAMISAMQEGGDAAKAGKDDDDDDDDFDDEPKDKPVENIKIATKKAVRVLPKFMRREEPQSEQGYILENFRLFEKKILLTIRECWLSEYLPNIENIWMCLPKEYSFIAEEMNKEAEDKKTRWNNLTVNAQKSIYDFLQVGLQAFGKSRYPKFNI